MARCRNLKPGFFSNEALPELGMAAHLLFAGLWTIADREGRLEDRPKRIKIECLPHYQVDVDALLNALAAGDDPFIQRYLVGGRRYIQVLNFKVHQSPHNTEKDSLIPEFPLSHESTTQNACAGIGIEAQGKREKEKKKDNAGRRAKRDRPQVVAANVPVPDGFEIPAVLRAITDWLDYKAARGEAYRDGAYLARKVAEFARAGPAAFVAAVNSSIGSNYSGLFPTKDSNGKSTTTRVGAGQEFVGE